MNYPFLLHGDQLPAVGVLQKLLNHAGARLVPDGIFGRRTLAAVLKFQHTHKLRQDGKVGEKTWGALVSQIDLPVVDAVDVGDPDFYDEDVKDIRQAGGNPIVLGAMCNGVEQLVQLICAQSNVFLLRLHGHGAPGVASAASGDDDGKPERSDIWDNPQVMASFRRLRSVFGPYGCLEFIQCETGRGWKGRHLLQHLARELDVPVTAATLDQPFGRTWTFRLYGPTVTMIPGGGTLKNWCASLPDF